MMQEFLSHISVPMVLVDGVLLAIFLLSVIIGAKRGFIMTVANIGSMIGAWFCASQFSGLLTDFFNERFFLPSISSKISTMLKNILTNVDFAADSATAALSERVTQLQEQVLAMKLLPSWEPIRVADFIPRSGTAEGAEDLAASVAGPVAERLSVIASYLVIFVAALILLRLAFGLLDKVFRLPLLNNVNKTLGGAVGAVTGFLTALVAAQVFSLVLGLLCLDGSMTSALTAGPIYGFLTDLI